jgi:SAM-dependent methyltransferase
MPSAADDHDASHTGAENTPKHATDHGAFSVARLHRLNDLRRLDTQLNEADLARLLALCGDEDVVDLGSGTGFYTDRIAALTTGTVYAVELQPEMNAHYRERGAPTNVRVLEGDITDLSAGPLAPDSVDVACTIATWHEIEGRLDAAGVARILRPAGRLAVVDWRRDPESWDSGPPEDIRSTREEVARALEPWFTVIAAEDLGRFMFAVTARRP